MLNVLLKNYYKFFQYDEFDYNDLLNIIFLHKY
uniref:Uncharacterized protein n=1 Tax=viral metagenome TaxID=1070528 RepID=A0A6C0EEP4_9ZZZZ